MADISFDSLMQSFSEGVDGIKVGLTPESEQYFNQEKKNKEKYEKKIEETKEKIDELEISIKNKKESAKSKYEEVKYEKPKVRHAHFKYANADLQNISKYRDEFHSAKQSLKSKKSYARKAEQSLEKAKSQKKQAKIDLKEYTDKQDKASLHFKNAQKYIEQQYHNFTEAMACIELATNCNFKISDDFSKMINELKSTKFEINLATKGVDPPIEKFIQKAQQLKCDLIQENPEYEKEISNKSKAKFVAREQRASEIEHYNENFNKIFETEEER